MIAIIWLIKGARGVCFALKSWKVHLNLVLLKYLITFSGDVTFLFYKFETKNIRSSKARNIYKYRKFKKMFIL